MKVYDLTHRIESGVSLYPGTEEPQFLAAATVEEQGYRETAICLFSHVGTHMDAPAHLLKDGKTMDELPAEKFLGSAFVLDVSGAGEDGAIPLSALLEEEENIRNAEFLLLYTGWTQKWKSPEYLAGFPVLTEEASRFLAALPGLKGVGMDTLSPDPVGDTKLLNHRILLGAGKLLLENLCGLGELTGRTLRLAALPLHYAEADGAPARVVAWEENA